LDKPGKYCLINKGGELLNRDLECKRLDFTIGDINEIYEGPVGQLWELLMGEEIHVGGEKETDILAKNAGIKRTSTILDLCSALGGPARHLARKYGCKVTGLDATVKMVNEAITRTERDGLTDLVSFRLGNALDIPFHAGTFDAVWGQDAWCYITDKERLIGEARRVLKTGGVIAFTDWIQTGKMGDKECEELNTFMAFPYLETLDGYGEILTEKDFVIVEKEDLSTDFAHHCRLYRNRLRDELRESIISKYGKELYQASDDGLNKWVKAADEGKVGRGRLIGKKIS